MSAHVFAFEASASHRPGAGPKLGGIQPEPGREPAGQALPDREWGLSAGQVAAAVAVIVAVSDVIGLLFQG